MPALARILDANANRAREALRVMEDVARLALDDGTLAGDLKRLRHDLRETLERLPAGWLEANRDVAGDVGTTIATAAESRRGGLLDVTAAAGKRLGEALRVLEETAKTVEGGLGGRFETLRYRAYPIEQRLLARLGSGRQRQWALCVLLTESLCTRAWPDVLRAACVDRGVDCIQVREKSLGDHALLERVRRIVEIARPAGVSVIVNDRVDVALAGGADGVHLGQDDLDVADARRLAGRTLLVGVSTHDAAEARDAVESGADYCGVGAMFPTALKPARRPSGPDLLRAFIETHPGVPHLAIGGITAENAPEIAAAGGRGVAVSAAVCRSEDPGGVVAALRETLAAR